MELPAVETFPIDCESLEGGVVVRIGYTAPPASGSELLPLICVLDAAFNFEVATAAARWLATAGRLVGGGLPPAIVVGIGYATDDLGEVMHRRARDLTPTDGPAPAGISLPEFRYGLGGAERFIDALEKHVLPAVEARHPADPEDRTLVGHSMGGLFGLYTLFTNPAGFGRYLIVSPSIWWDDRVILRYERDWAERHRDLPARVFLAVGGGEQSFGSGWKNEGFPDAAIKAARQVDNARDLSAALAGRRHPRLEFESVVLDGEYHLTVGPAAITRGLISLFSDA